MLNNIRMGLRLGYENKRRHLETDTDGFSTGAIVAVVIGGFFAILIALILIPTLTNQVYLISKNVTTIGDATHNGVPGALGLLNLVGLMFILVAVVVPVILALYVLKQVE